VTEEASIVSIERRDCWFKIGEFLQQNWALVDAHDRGAIAWFINNTSGVFDEIAFGSMEDASRALSENGFRRFAEDDRAHTIMRPPEPPFMRRRHPNGPIYSSGRFWI
jgi:hypothetical protein